MDDDIFTDIKREKTRRKADNSLFNIIFILLLSLSTGIFAFAFYQHITAIKQSGSALQTKYLQAKYKQQYSYSSPVVVKSSYYKNSANEQRKLRAKKKNLEVCNYWTKQYNSNFSEYARLMQADACKRAGVKIINQKQQPHISQITINHYQQTTDYYRENKSCSRLFLCKQYKRNLESLRSRMRQGYSASQSNSFHDREIYWQNKLYKQCRCYSPSDYR